MRICTCLGTCRGAAGLAPGWVCALEMDNILAKHPADPIGELRSLDAIEADSRVASGLEPDGSDEPPCPGPIVDCPNCESKMNEGDACSECDHNDHPSVRCDCAYCRHEVDEGMDGDVYLSGPQRG